MTAKSPTPPPGCLAAAVAASASGGAKAGEPDPELEAPLPDVAAAVAVISNPDLGWEDWNDIGLAIYGATGGSNEGFALFDRFSRQSAKYDATGTFEKWAKYRGCPPDRIGFGSLAFWADAADPNWRDSIADDAQQDAAKTQHDAGTRSATSATVSATVSELGEWDAGELLTNGKQPPPRQWLIYRYFCRRFLSGLVAPGDAGKTTLRLTQAIELATGRQLLGQRIFQRCRVLVLSFEDDRDELWRRLAAICKHHHIEAAELRGWLYCRDLSGIKLAELNARKLRQIGPLDAMLRRAIERNRYDCVILDPFVKLHGLNENDNPDMDFVCERLIAIAQQYNIAIDSPAHTHKGAVAAGDADARRGATAQCDAGRLDYTLTPMSEDEAKKFGIDPDERKTYVRLDRAKANIVRAIKATWFRLVNVPLANTSELYPDGDAVQAIELWEAPETWAGLSPEALNAILDDLDTGLANGQRYSDAGRATARAAWKVVQKHCPNKTEEPCREIIRQWLKAAVLFRDDYDDPVERKSLKGLYVDVNKRPQY